MTRTRGGGNGRPDLDSVARKRGDYAIVDLVNDEGKESDESNDSSEEEEEDVAEPPTKIVKPMHTRVILEVSQLQQAFRDFPCPDCGEALELNLRTVCIATSIQLICNNQECSYVSNFDKPCPTTMHEEDRGDYERMTDYAVNVLYVLGFISMGDAHTEAGRLLGLLGLPNDTTMMNRSFGIIEDRVGPFLRELCADIIEANILDEAKLSMTEFDFNVWQAWKEGKGGAVGDLPKERWPHLDASYDMAWQQKGSGKV
jgi:hypothetical protein